MEDLQTYISALFTVFIIVIFIRILLSFIPTAPGSRWARAFWDFCHQSTEWFLGFFRRIIPPVGMFDLSPIVALLVLYIVRGLVLTLLDGF
ncbi:MAG: YggT family protein [Thermoleophilia bacterium]